MALSTERTKKARRLRRSPLTRLAWPWKPTKRRRRGIYIVCKIDWLSDPVSRAEICRPNNVTLSRDRRLHTCIASASQTFGQTISSWIACPLNVRRVTSHARSIVYLCCHDLNCYRLRAWRLASCPFHLLPRPLFAACSCDSLNPHGQSLWLKIAPLTGINPSIYL